jgi:hypothetical protein
MRQAPDRSRVSKASAGKLTDKTAQAMAIRCRERNAESERIMRGDGIEIE